MWDCRQKGESLHSIARLFGRGHSSIQRILSETGGIRPSSRIRSRLALKLAEREEISRGVVGNRAIRSIAESLGRTPSTVSREIRRNGGRHHYRAGNADQSAWDRSRRPKTCKLVERRQLARVVAKKLKELWSPVQMSGWLKDTYPNDGNFQVSHETIYRSLFLHTRGALKKELLQHLRRTRAMRRSRHHTQKTDTHGRIIGTVSIRQRPACVEDRAVPRHWEGDLIIGSHNSQIATLVERSTKIRSRASISLFSNAAAAPSCFTQLLHHVAGDLLLEQLRCGCIEDGGNHLVAFLHSLPNPGGFHNITYLQGRAVNIS